MAGPDHKGSKSLLITALLPTRFLPSARGLLVVLRLGAPTLSANIHPICGGMQGRVYRRWPLR